jgi:Methyltransferase FkbM domain
VTSDKQGSHRVARHPVVESKATVQVEAITLDGLVTQGVIDLDRVGLLWIDAPKHEANVLLGASRFLEAGVPVVTAIRVSGRRGDPSRPWDVPAETKALVLERLAGNYTDAVLLRKNTPLDQTTAIDDLGTFVDSFKSIQDLLLVRR